MSRNARIARNTFFLYFRLLFTVGVSLYTVRVVLNALGVDEFGIYNVVAGIVAMLSFLTASLASATQRYFSFALGANDPRRLKATFTVNGVIYSAIAIVALIVLESAGLWFVSDKLNVPAERMAAVISLYHFSVMTLIAGIFSAPFMAILIAHEDMKTYAYISIVEALLKLAAASMLVHLPLDKLPLYGALLFTVALLVAITYASICFRKYDECQFRIFYWDKALLREIVGFTSWTLFGQLTTVVRNHAVTILLNQMTNPAVVAARAIAVNVGAQANMFSQNFNVSLYPAIIKSYASGNRQQMFGLVFAGSKITFFLMWALSLPLFMQMETVLNLWLKNPPEHAVLFTRLALWEALILSVSLPLATAARAPGKMRLYELTLGAMQLAILPLSWGILRLGYEPHAVFLVAIAMNILMFFGRLLIVRRLIGISVRGFLNQVVLPVLAIAALSSTGSFAVDTLLPDGFLFSCLSVLCSLILTCTSAYWLGLDAEWRLKARNLVAKKFSGRRGEK